jgi:hypothetical protein
LTPTLIMIKHTKAFILLSLTLLLSACTDDKDVIDVQNPEVATVAFFNAIYNEKNLKKAASVCSPKLARIILHYKSPKAVGRHLFNMSYDSVEITPEASGVKVREQFKKNAKITVYFVGTYMDEKIKDIKRVSLIQKDGKWIIDKILKDPF